MIFCDASVLLAAEDVDNSDHEDALALLRSGQVLATLDLALYEVANVAAVRWRDPDAAVRLRERISAIADYGELVRADRSLIEDATRLATQHSLSVYDAAYLAGADRLTARWRAVTGTVWWAPAMHARRMTCCRRGSERAPPPHAPCSAGPIDTG